MALNWSVLSSSFKSSGFEDIYSATYSYSQAKSLKSAYTALKGSENSAKNSKEAGKISSRLATLNQSISNNMSAVDPFAAWKTSSGSSRISDLAKQEGKKMYEAATGKGTVVDEEV